MRDVLASHPQGRDGQRQYVQAIEQILAKLAVLHEVEQFAIGRRDDADIDLHRLAAANGFDRAFLQRAQQFDLCCQRQFADLVEEQRAPGGLDELAHVAFGRRR